MSEMNGVTLESSCTITVHSDKVMITTDSAVDSPSLDEKTGLKEEIDKETIDRRKSKIE